MRRYALEVNVERAEDVLTHMRLLRQAQDHADVLAYHVSVVQVLVNSIPYVFKLCWKWGMILECLLNLTFFGFNPLKGVWIVQERFVVLLCHDFNYDPVYSTLFLLNWNWNDFYSFTGLSSWCYVTQ